MQNYRLLDRTTNCTYRIAAANQEDGVVIPDGHGGGYNPVISFIIFRPDDVCYACVFLCVLNFVQKTFGRLEVTSIDAKACLISKRGNFSIFYN